MTVLTIILIILFFCIMSMVEKIQGTARVVNYAGLVRGKTQRIIKLEDAGEPQDTMIADINAYIDGLQNGSSELDLVRLDDRDFQDKMTELASYFEELKAEILLVREKGYENTAIIEKSETFFKICDEATGLAEAYSQRMASSLKKLEQVVQKRRTRTAELPLCPARRMRRHSDCETRPADRHLHRQHRPFRRYPLVHAGTSPAERDQTGSLAGRRNLAGKRYQTGRLAFILYCQAVQCHD